MYRFVVQICYKRNKKLYFKATFSHNMANKHLLYDRVAGKMFTQAHAHPTWINLKSKTNDFLIESFLQFTTENYVHILGEHRSCEPI